jgi:hypothetical protein
MRVGDQVLLWAWFWMNQGMTISLLQNRELLSWSIKISLNKLNLLKSILWILPWGQDFTSLPVYREINPAVHAVVRNTPRKSLNPNGDDMALNFACPPELLELYSLGIGSQRRRELADLSL